jgi:hypothetical protein
MSNAVVVLSPPADALLPAVPWRDPHTVPPDTLADYIRRMEAECLAHPQSADLRTCLGMAYAVNFEVYKSMDALEAATAAEPDHFWARLKYAELHYRLRALPRAEEETRKAIDLAVNAWQLSIARTQLRQIRKLLHEGTRTVTWTKSLTAPALTLVGLLVLVAIGMVWR